MNRSRALQHGIGDVGARVDLSPKQVSRRSLTPEQPVTKRVKLNPMSQAKATGLL